MRRRNARLFWGVLFMVAGVTFVLVRFGILSASLLKLWPIGVLLIGFWLIAGAVREPKGRGLTAGIVVTAVGGFLMARELWQIDEGLFIGVLLTALGLGLVLRNLLFRTR